VMGAGKSSFGLHDPQSGLPNVQFFPYDTLEAQIAKPDRWTPSSADALPVQDLRLADAAHLTVPKALAEQDPLKKIDLATALQYGLAQGYPPLLSWIRQFTRDCLHPDVPYRDGPEVMLTVGATDGFAKTLEVFVNPWSPERDPIEERPGMLVETFVYANVLAQALPKGVQTVAVRADSGGMCAAGEGGLEDVLENWDYSTGRRPHLMYTVT
jgi:DNA-binding transcriptional MocR family regulator